LVHFGVIGPTVMLANPDGGITQLPLPRRVQDWIEHFDASQPVQPMGFELELPETPTAPRGRASHRRSLEPILPPAPLPFPSGCIAGGELGGRFGGEEELVEEEAAAVA